RVEHRAVGDVDAGDEQVAAVEADAEARMGFERVEERCELVDRAADRAAGARRVLEQQPRAVVAELEHRPERWYCAFEPGVESGAEVRADVDDDSFGLDRAG